MVGCLDFRGDGERQTKVVLLWARRWTPLCQLSTNVLREVCSYLYRRNYIIMLLGREIAIFDIEKRSFQRAKLSKSIPLYCVYCDLTVKSILVLGFNTKSVFSLSFPDLNFAPQPAMFESRSSPGLIRCGSFIYAFGGYLFPNSRKYSERYSISEGAWQRLPDMHSPKASFCPVLHRQHIYLPKLFGVSWLECFDTGTLKFTVVGELPKGTAMSVCAVIGEEIILLTGEFVYTVTVGKALRIRKLHAIPNCAEPATTQATPLVFGREMWFMIGAKRTAVRYRLDDQDIRVFS